MNTTEIEDKIQYLLKNKELGLETFYQNKQSNCVGTAGFVLDFDIFLKLNYEDRLKSKDIPFFELDLKNETDTVILPEPHNRPGFSGRLPFKLLLEDKNFFRNTSNPKKYDLIVFKDLEFNFIRHAAIYLDENFMFQQHNLGGVFEIEHQQLYKIKLTPLVREYYTFLN